MQRRNTTLSLTVELDFNMIDSSKNIPVTEKNIPDSKNILPIDSSNVIVQEASTTIAGRTDEEDTTPSSVKDDVKYEGGKDLKEGIVNEGVNEGGKDGEEEEGPATSVSLDVDRDSTLLHLKVHALWGLRRIQPLLDIDHSGGRLVSHSSSGITDGGVLDIDSGSGGNMRKVQEERIVRLIDNTRLRLGDTRGEL